MFQTTNQKKKKTVYKRPILPGMIIVIFVSGMILLSHIDWNTTYNNGSKHVKTLMP